MPICIYLILLRMSKRIGGENCAVMGCTNYRGKTTDISYHKFPNILTDQATCQKWISLCRQPKSINLSRATICSIHFREEDYELDLKSKLLGTRPRRVLLPNAVPSLNLPFQCESPTSLQRKAEKEKEIQQKFLLDALNDPAYSTDETCRGVEKIPLKKRLISVVANEYSKTPYQEVPSAQTTKFKERPDISGVHCAICNNSSGKPMKGSLKISFHKFPKDPHLRRQWLKLCNGKAPFNPQNAFVCSEHFEDSDFQSLECHQTRRLKKGVIPHLKISNCLLTKPTKEEPQHLIQREDSHPKEQGPEVVRLMVVPDIRAIVHTPCMKVSDSHRTPVTTEENHPKAPNLEQMTVAADKRRRSLNEKNVDWQVSLDYKNVFKHVKKLLKKTKSENAFLRKKLIEYQESLTELRVENYKKNGRNAEELRKENELLKKKLEDYSRLNRAFSQNQMKILTGTMCQARWTNEEMEKAMKLARISKKAYKYVKDELHYPLPGLSSLYRWNWKKEKAAHLSEDSDCSTDTASEGSSHSASPGPGRRLVNETNDDTLTHIAGWLAEKFMNKYNLGSFLTNETEDHNYSLPSWIKHLSHGRPVVPHQNLCALVRRMERLFTKFCNNVGVIKGNQKKVLKKLCFYLCKRMAEEEIPPEVVQAFARQRLLIKMKYLNANPNIKSVSKEQKVRSKKRIMQKGRKAKKPIIEKGNAKLAKTDEEILRPGLSHQATSGILEKLLTNRHARYTVMDDSNPFPVEFEDTLETTTAVLALQDMIETEE